MLCSHGRGLRFCVLFQRLFHFLLSSKLMVSEKCGPKLRKQYKPLNNCNNAWKEMTCAHQWFKRKPERMKKTNNLIYIYLMAFVRWPNILWMLLIDHQFDLITLAIVLAGQLQIWKNCNAQPTWWRWTMPNVGVKKDHWPVATICYCFHGSKWQHISGEQEMKK